MVKVCEGMVVSNGIHISLSWLWRVWPETPSSGATSFIAMVVRMRHGLPAVVVQIRPAHHWMPRRIVLRKLGLT